MAQNIVIAIDPGREKCGIAVVHKEQGLIYKTIAATVDLPGVVTTLAATHNVFVAVIGDRTTSHTARATLAAIKVNGQRITIIPVNEHHSTDEARKRYWLEHPPKGIKRLLPTTMQVPPGPVDDYVAVILAERYFVGQ